MNTDARAGEIETGEVAGRGGVTLPSWRRVRDLLLLRRLAVSSRVMVALTALSAVGLLLATAVFWWSEDRVRRQSVHAELVQEVEELRTLAVSGRDPDTGEPFASTASLMATYLSRNVPNQHEGFLVLIDWKIPFLSPFDEGLNLERKDAMIALGRSVQPRDPVLLTETMINGREFAVVAVPVTVAGDPAHGVFVAASDVTAELAESDVSRRAQVFVVIGLVLLIGMAAAVIVHTLLRPLRTLSAATERITEQDLAERIPETGADDIATLSRTVNGMLDRLEAAFEGQRELLDDVGHELRTPLTVIRGHLELMDPDDPADVRETAELAMDEADRMARLVEELVLLAKSMRPDFVTVREVNIDDVVNGLFERSGALGDRRWRIDHLCGARVAGDSQRLVQAGLQLMSNAVRHTNEDDEIGIGAAVDGDVVRLWVRDTGEGVPAAEQQRIFERAVRGASTRQRTGAALPPALAGSLATSDTSSSGLGLAIVTAIAEAHGGRVTLASTHGAGSTFAVELPLPEDEDTQEEHR